MTERFQIIHLGNPYDFVIKDHETNRTYGTFQGDDKSLKDCLDDIENEIKMLRTNIQKLTGDVEYLVTLPSEHRELYKQSEVKRANLLEENKQLKAQVEALSDLNNQELSEFEHRVFDLINEKIENGEKAIEWGERVGADNGAMRFYIGMLKQLKKELKE